MHLGRLWLAARQVARPCHGAPRSRRDRQRAECENSWRHLFRHRHPRVAVRSGEPEAQSLTPAAAPMGDVNVARGATLIVLAVAGFSLSGAFVRHVPGLTGWQINCSRGLALAAPLTVYLALA